MKAPDVRMLWAYAAELWGSTFTIPDSQALRQVKERVWLDVLGDLDAELVRRAMVSMSVHFAPTPVELREAAQALAASRIDGEAPHDAQEALKELHGLVARYGYMRPAEALTAADAWDPALGAVIRTLGWLQICTDDNEAVFRGQFRVLYETASSRILRAARPVAPILASAGQLEAGGNA